MKKTYYLLFVVLGMSLNACVIPQAQLAQLQNSLQSASPSPTPVPSNAVIINCPAWASVDIQFEYTVPGFPSGAGFTNSGRGGIGNGSHAFNSISVQQHAVLCYYDDVQQSIAVHFAFIDASKSCSQTGSASAICL